MKLSGGSASGGACQGDPRDAPILVLDEATSALGGRSRGGDRRHALRADGRQDGGCDRPRLSTIARMDQIVVLDQGRIVEQGSHADLQTQGGLYARFWTRQSGGFIGCDPAWTPPNRPTSRARPARARPGHAGPVRAPADGRPGWLFDEPCPTRPDPVLRPVDASTTLSIPTTAAISPGLGMMLRLAGSQGYLHAWIEPAALRLRAAGSCRPADGWERRRSCWNPALLIAYPAPSGCRKPWERLATCGSDEDVGSRTKLGRRPCSVVPAGAPTGRAAYRGEGRANPPRSRRSRTRRATMRELRARPPSPRDAAAGSDDAPNRQAARRNASRLPRARR